MYNGLFFGLNFSANLVTFPLVGYLIGNYSKVTFYIIMAIISIVGILFFFMLTEPIKTNKSDDEKEEESK